MGFKNFKLQVIIRLILVSIAIGVLLYYVIITGQYLRSIYLFVFVILIIIEFVYYVEKTHRDFTSFLLAILQDDFSTTFHERGKGKSIQNFYSTLNRITRKFKAISSEKELQYLYLETLVEHIKVGILTYDENENIHLINEALKKLLDRPVLTKLKGIENIDPVLLQSIREIKPTENRLVKVTVNNHLQQLSIHASEFKLKDKYFKLISMQNIKHELEAQELDAWQKLIRVLTHEIMNSVTPITSLSATLQDIIKKEKKQLPASEFPFVDNLDEGLDAIKSRSEGLQTFTQAYKNLTRLPTPEFQKVKIKELLKQVETLLKPDLDHLNVKLHIHLENPELEILVDSDLFDQVLINIIKNGMEAVQKQKDGRIRLTVTENGHQVFIRITDNGAGIPEDKIDKIFIPFFTTKKNGTGVGLALCRQILQMHNATIAVSSYQGEGTTFTIVL